MESKGLFCFVFMDILSVLCVLGIITFSEIYDTIIDGDGYICVVVDIYYLNCLLLQPD